jgi:hypothetical protein
MSKIISFGGLVTTLIIAYACDLLIELIRVRAFATFVFTPYLLLAGIVNLFLAILVFLLTWYIVFRADKSTLVSSTFVLIGLALIFVPVIVPSLISRVAFTPNSHMLYVSGFITVIGIAGFVIPKRLST